MPGHHHPRPLSRRAVVRLLGGSSVAAAGSLLLAACTPAGRDPTTSSAPSENDETMSATAGDRTVVVFFSRTGENYWNGGRRDLTVGNTERVARMIVERLGCDVVELTAADPYSDDYDDTVARNVREENADARPAIAGGPPSVADYDTVLVGSPIWNVRPPMIMNTFVDSVDWSGKTLHPFVTYAVSRLGATVDVYRDAAPDARLRDALAIRGEESADAGAEVAAWLRRIGLG